MIGLEMMSLGMSVPSCTFDTYPDLIYKFFKQ